MVDRLQDMEVQVQVDQDMEDHRQDMVRHHQVMAHHRQDTVDLQEAMDRWVARADLILDTLHMVVHLQVATDHHQEHMVLLLQAMEHLLTAMVALLLLDMVALLVAATVVHPLATVGRHLQRVVHSFHPVGSSTLIQRLAGHTSAIAPLARRNGIRRWEHQHLGGVHLHLDLDLQEHLARPQAQLLCSLMLLVPDLVRAPVLVLAQVLDLVLLQRLDLVLLPGRVYLQDGSRHQILQVAGLTSSTGRLARRNGSLHLCRRSFLA